MVDKDEKILKNEVARLLNKYNLFLSDCAGSSNASLLTNLEHIFYVYTKIMALHSESMAFLDNLLSKLSINAHDTGNDSEQLQFQYDAILTEIDKLQDKSSAFAEDKHKLDMALCFIKAAAGLENKKFGDRPINELCSIVEGIRKERDEAQAINRYFGKLVQDISRHIGHPEDEYSVNSLIEAIDNYRATDSDRKLKSVIEALRVIMDTVDTEQCKSKEPMI